MHYALCLVTATWMAGAQVGGPVYGGSQSPGVPLQQLMPTTPEPAPAPAAHPIRDWFRSHFGSHSETPTGSSEVLIRQTPGTMPPGPMIPTTTVTTLRPNYELASKDQDRVGHEKDYSWITGRVARQGSQWVIRYAAPNEIDRYAGSLVLNADVSKLHEGDLVCVVGQVVGGQGSRGAVYQAREVNVIEHAGR
jgi:hypothetical protein